MITSPQKAISFAQVQIPDEQRIKWVRLMLEKMGRRKALLPLFDHLLELLRSNFTGKGGVDKTSLTMVERFGAASDGKTAWTNAQKEYDASPKKRDMERKVWQNVDRLAEALYELCPPGYPAPILLEREGKACWLSGLQISPVPQVTDEWYCLIDEKPVKTGPIRLAYTIARYARPRLVVEGAWKPSKHFSNYAQFKRARWEQYRDKNPKCHNSPTLFFSDIRSEGEVLEVRAKRGEYADYVATIQSLDHTVSLSNGREKKVSEVLMTKWNPRSNLLPLPVASPVALDLMIITKEETVLVCDDKRSQRWSVSVSALPSLVSDGHDKDAVEVISRTIRRRTYEELGIEIKPEKIAWMAFGVGRRTGHTGFVGQIKLQQTEQQIRSCFENRKERDEVRGIEFLPLEVPAVQKFLKTRDCRYFLRLGLHLCLWRKFPDRVKISVR